MTEKLGVITERVDDIPVLIAAQDHMGVAELVDTCFVTHGNWQGISLGKTVSGWLGHILSEADHRLNRVEDWVAKRIQTLRCCLDEAVRDLDFSDDRLTIVLDLLSDDARWAAFETALNQRTIRVYNLKPGCVRIDSTTASRYGQVTEDGLFQFGHSKDHRPDLPQVKVVLSMLDPLGVPVVTQVVAGEKADDPLYIPAIDQVRDGVGQSGLLYVGDCKLMALATRAHLQAGHDHYLGPFSLVQIPQATADEYLTPVWRREQLLAPVYRQDDSGQEEKIAEGFERSQTLNAVVDGKTIIWVERQLVIRSLAQAQAAETALQRRLQQAQQAIESLNERKRGKKRFTDVEMLRQATETLIQQHQVEGLLAVQYSEQVHERRVRKYKERQVSVAVWGNESAVQEAIRRQGWRVYGTNAPAGELSLEQAVLAYRAEYLVERNFGRLKGKPLTLTPMYLEDDDRVTGLIRLLSLGLRVLTLLEYIARCRLVETGEKLSGLYAGNPKRATDRPTTEALLRAFKDIFLNVVNLDEQTYRHLTPLSELQLKILALLDLPAEIYTRLAHFAIPP